MKKIYTTAEYRRWHKRRTLKSQKRQKRKRQQSQIVDEQPDSSASNGTSYQRVPKIKPNAFLQNYDIKLPVVAPADLRLIDNLDGCLEFFRELRSEENVGRRGKLRYVIMSLENVTQIDYGTTSILTSLNDDLKFRTILLKTILPKNQACRDYMEDSGYLNNLVDGKGKPFKKTEKSDVIFFEKGTGFLSNADSMKISRIVKHVVGHLTGVEKYWPAVTTIILEICGNSIEWSGTGNRQWLLGVKYEPARVIFTVTDVGNGILETLYRSVDKRIFDTLQLKTSDSILKGAFEKKYGSTTQEENRNKGLPSVKLNFERGNIQNLKVLTNNVILHFDDDSRSRQFKRGYPRFKGTFYQWELTKACLKNLNIST